MPLGKIAPRQLCKDRPLVIRNPLGRGEDRRIGQRRFAPPRHETACVEGSFQRQVILHGSLLGDKNVCESGIIPQRRFTLYLHMQVGLAAEAPLHRAEESVVSCADVDVVAARRTDRVDEAAVARIISDRAQRRLVAHRDVDRALQVTEGELLGAAPVDQDRALLDRLGLPGMRVLLFAFGAEDGSEHHAPHSHSERDFVYTGTHDNNTVRGWFEGDARKDERERFFGYIGCRVSAGRVHEAMIRLARERTADPRARFARADAEEIVAGRSELTLDDLLCGLIVYNSEAVADFLLSRLDPTAIASLYRRLGISDTDAPFSTLGLYLVLSNHETGTADPDDLSEAAFWKNHAQLAEKYLTNEAWREAERAYRARPDGGMPDYATQAAFLERFGAHGTAADLADRHSLGRACKTNKRVYRRSVSTPLALSFVTDATRLVWVNPNRNPHVGIAFAEAKSRTRAGEIGTTADDPDDAGLSGSGYDLVTV